MNVIVDRAALSAALNAAVAAAGPKTHPILASVLLYASGDTIEITATDTTAAYVKRVPATVQKDGGIAINASEFAQVVKLLTGPNVSLMEVSGHRLEVQAGRATYKLPGTPADEFPPLPVFDEAAAVTLAERDLLRLVRQSSVAVSTDDTRMGLNGAHLHIVERNGDSYLRMACTDGHRMAASETLFGGEFYASDRKLVSRRALGLLKRILSDTEDVVSLAIGDGSMRLTRGDEVLWFRMIDGEFPDYQRVLPTSPPKHRIRMSKADLADAIKRVDVLVTERVKAARFDFQEQEVVASVHSVDRGEITEAIPVELEGAPIVVGFNARYLGEALGVLTGDHVTLELGHALAPCIVRDPDCADVFLVVMPMRLD